MSHKIYSSLREKQRAAHKRNNRRRKYEYYAQVLTRLGLWHPGKVGRT